MARKKKKPDKTADNEGKRSRAFLQTLRTAQGEQGSAAAGRTLERLDAGSFAKILRVLDPEEKTELIELLPRPFPEHLLGAGFLEKVLHKGGLPWPARKRLVGRLIDEAPAGFGPVPDTASALAREALPHSDLNSLLPWAASSLPGLPEAWRKFIIEGIAGLASAGNVTCSSQDISDPRVDNELASEIIEALGKTGGLETARLLDDALALSPLPPVKKAIRKALYQLKLRGIAVPEEKTAPKTPSPPSVSEDALDALLTATDPWGHRFFAIPLSTRFGDWELAMGRIADRGVKEFNTGRANKKKIKEAMEAFKDQLDAPVYPVPRDHALALLGEAHGRAPEESTREFTAWKKTRPLPGQDVIRSQIDRVPVQEADLGIPDARRFFEHEVVRGWLVEKEIAIGLRDRINGIKQGAIIVPESMLHSRREEAMAGFLREHFDEEGREIMARRLEETAIILHGEGQAELASRSVVTARSIRANEPDRVPFLRDFIQFNLEFLTEVEQEQERKEQQEKRILSHEDARSIHLPGEPHNKNR